MNGKEKCEALKSLRKKIADENGIPYEPRECNFEGECDGTCPACEAEADYLNCEIKKLEERGNIEACEKEIIAREIEDLKLKSETETMGKLREEPISEKNYEEFAQFLRRMKGEDAEE